MLASAITLCVGLQGLGGGATFIKGAGSYGLVVGFWSSQVVWWVAIWGALLWIVDLCVGDNFFDRRWVARALVGVYLRGGARVVRYSIFLQSGFVLFFGLSGWARCLIFLLPSCL